MMQLYKEIDFPFVAELTTVTLDYLSTRDITSGCKMPIEGPLLTEINKFFESRKISNLGNCAIFNRKGTLKKYIYSHIDGYDNFVNACSIVIPISGCERTEHVWFDGDYERVSGISKEGIPFNKPLWKSPGIQIGAFNILKSPTLCRTDIPHLAYSNGSDRRITCTIRTAANESFEYLSEMLS